MCIDLSITERCPIPSRAPWLPGVPGMSRRSVDAGPVSEYSKTVECAGVAANNSGNANGRLRSLGFARDDILGRRAPQVLHLAIQRGLSGVEYDAFKGRGESVMCRSRLNVR